MGPTRFRCATMLEEKEKMGIVIFTCTGTGNRTRANAEPCALCHQWLTMKERYPKPLDHTGNARSGVRTHADCSKGS